MYEKINRKKSTRGCSYSVLNCLPGFCFDATQLDFAEKGREGKGSVSILTTITRYSTTVVRGSHSSQAFKPPFSLCNLSCTVALCMSLLLRTEYMANPSERIASIPFLPARLIFWGLEMRHPINQFFELQYVQ